MLTLHNENHETINVVYNQYKVEKYSTEIEKKVQQIHPIIFKNPTKAIEQLKVLIEQHPHVTQFYNFLAGAYLEVGDEEKMQKAIRMMYAKHPNYLFAKCAYADLCLQEDKLDEIEKIVGNARVLTDLYPQRKTFHVTEVIAFHDFMARYTTFHNRPEEAYQHIRWLALVDDMSPSIQNYQCRVVVRNWKQGKK